MVNILHIAIVILHYHNVDDTKECLQSLNKVVYDNLSIIIVNNGSRDFDEIQFRAIAPNAIIVQSETNLGFSAGNNLGIVAALENDADWVMLLNNDTIVESNLITAFLPHLQHDDVGILSPVIAFYDDPAKIWFAGGAYVPLVGYSYRTRPMTTFDGIRECDWANGCTLLIRREVLEQIGDLWDELFLYGEDLEFSIRATKAGWRCLTIGDKLVYHKISSSSGAKGGDSLSPTKAYYFARNYLLLIHRHAKGLTWLTGIISQFVIILPIRMGMMLRSGSSKSISSYIQGLWHGLRNISGKRPPNNTN